MKRSQRLTPAADMAKRKERDAARGLDAVRGQLVQEQARLADLTQYYQEYDQLFKSQKRGLRPQDLLARRDFMAQLSKTCKAQQGQIERVMSEFEKAKRHWHQCYLKHENLCAFIDKIAREELAEADKIEQGRADEWVTQNFARRD